MEEKENVKLDDIDNIDSPSKSESKNENDEAKWYIVTSITGNEDTVYKNIEDKVRAYNLEEVVQEIKLLKTREITVEVFDQINNPPPTRFRNTKSITWETLPGNRYKKTRVRYVNKFPGYIYIKMLMADDAWYIIRNTFGVTGFVGSSGKGAKPIPMSDFEVENLFNPELNKDIIIEKTHGSFVEATVEKPAKSELENKIEFLAKSEPIDEEGFFDSKLGNNQSSEVKELESDNSNENENSEISANESIGKDNEYFENHDQIIDEIVVDKTDQSAQEQIDESSEQEDSKPEFIDIHHHGNSQNKSEFPVGSVVELVSGSMQGYDATITEVDVINKKAKVAIDMLGRETIVDVDFSQLRKKD